jgi:hypothetical protein
MSASAAAWSALPARVRGLLASVLSGVALAMLTALQLQLLSGHVTWSAVLLAAETATVAGAIQFIHGLRLPQEGPTRTWFARDPQEH